MSELKRTVLYDVHVKAGATMVDFGGWDMPVQYPTGIIAEHLYTRSVCSLFDVSHMGRLVFTGPEREAFLQHVLSSNVAALDVNKAQYCIIPDENGSAVDDAYLYCYDEDSFMLVVNAANIDKDVAWLTEKIKGFDCTMTNISNEWASIAVQGPKSEEMMTVLTGGVAPTAEPKRNCLSTMSLEGHEMRISRTGYTGEPIGYEVFMKNEDAEWLWNRLVELGAKPAGLGARDTLRLEGGLPLYGHEMGLDHDGNPMPIFAAGLAKFAVSFAEEKGDFIGREALAKQRAVVDRIKEKDFSDLADLPKRVLSIALLDRGVIRAGMNVYKDGKQVGWVTSGTMVPYYVFEGEEPDSVMTEQTGKRSIGFAYVDSDVRVGNEVEIELRPGKFGKAKIVSKHVNANVPPFVKPVLVKP